MVAMFVSPVGTADYSESDSDSAAASPASASVAASAVAARRSRPRVPRPRLRPRGLLRLGRGAARARGPARRSGAGLAAGDPLVGVGLEAVGEVAGERLEQPGRLHERRLEAAGQAGEEHLAGLDVGQRRDVGGVSTRGAEQPALHHQSRGACGRSRATPWPRPRRRPGRRRSRSGPRAAPRGRSSPASSAARRASVFLNTLYSVDAGRSAARRVASSVTVRPRYSVRIGGVGFVELGADLVDDGDLFGSRHVRAPEIVTDRGAPDPRDAPSSTRSRSPGGSGFPRARPRSAGRRPITPAGAGTEGLRRVQIRSERTRCLAGGHLARSVGLWTVGSILTPGPIVDDVLTLLRYRPFDAAGLARFTSSSTAW